LRGAHPQRAAQLYQTFAKGDVAATIALNLKLCSRMLAANEHRSSLVPASPDVERQFDKVLTGWVC
jgi:hypothetical protein